jgi:rhamnose utilization protein RhaD (predicted bifunctional aldolase and dehydrogenase)
MSTSNLDSIVHLSREYGRTPGWVIGGGGNTSIKDQDHLWIKASGATLERITAEQFVKMSRSRLDAIWETVYPQDPETREQRALADLMAARLPGEEHKRPSVETLMHALFPQRIVFHTHPTMLNGLTCSREGGEALERLLGDRALWVPTVNPGYVLARTIFDLVQQWRAAHDGEYPPILVLQNHGVVVAGEGADEIRALHREITDAIETVTRTRPDQTPPERDPAHLEDIRDTVARAVADFRAAHGDALNPPVTITFTAPELLERARSLESFAAVDGALTPDHIVYSGHRPCYVSESSMPALRAEILSAVMEYCHDYDACPKIVVVRDQGAVAVGGTEKKADLAVKLFLDALEVVRYAESFGGVQHMPEDQVEFIRNWEVEAFREQISTS